MIQSYTNILANFLELQRSYEDISVISMLFDITDCILASHYCSSRSYESRMGLAMMVTRILSQVNVVVVGLHIDFTQKQVKLLRQYIENYLYIANNHDYPG